ncbi:MULTISPECIES: GNAT family N-acetyltransferase [unclassified Zobellia]|uniref:GNAT family N-acetyltransferase n=1 Tax=unclassified Zobellia TaxID=2620635 RepID=UPI001C0769BE|nr:MULTISPECIES: GNAT family N-acetyltransferase [unclassified Zobellia]MBU2976366.1 GNAT family N-acetyltransferase [Zobellia sp. B3R18]MDO6819360.1 GNAT family N-acetyltransferase [Zobellia sp. 1_MG-2023]
MKIRKATESDLPAIVQLLANDKLGKLREDYKVPLPQKYYDAFNAINGDKNQELMVFVNETEQVIGTMQLSFIPYLTYQGGVRAQIEAVRVHEDYRSKGIGRQLFKWAIQRAGEKGAHVVQLTTDKKRPDALKFYQNLGFTASHEGMKFHL